jgi:hypothetical protein
VTCSGFGASIVGGFHGASSAKGALAKWLKTHPKGYDADVTAWHLTHGGHVYADGKAHVTVSGIPSPGSGYIVTEGSTC